MFLQIHTLTSFHASLLNRDDAGLAKRIPFGNATRLRVSSQCRKRHWRDYLCGHAELDKPGLLADLSDGYRSRNTFSRLVVPKAIALLEEAAAKQADAPAPLIPTEPQTSLILDAMLKELGLRKKKKGEGGDDSDESPGADENTDGTKNKGVKDDMSQPIFLGTREIDHLASVFVDAVEAQAQAISDYHAATSALASVNAKDRPKLEKKRDDAFAKSYSDHFKKSGTDFAKNLAQLAQSAMGKSGLTSALFGRMITSTLLANVLNP